MVIVWRLLIATTAIAAVIYGVDYLKVARNPSPFGSIDIKPYYAIHLKNKKIDYDFSPPAETEVCVESLFPHFGDRPCWYAARHKQEKIEE
jgi:hypothetical protein